MLLKRGFVASLLGTAILLSGCSGHPGTGSWQAADKNADPFSSMEVAFDGKAQLIKGATSGADTNLRCLWQATSKENLLLQCREAAHPDTTVQYQLQIRTDNRAALYQNEQLVMGFIR